MRKGHFHICLYQPEIPQNTGSIARLIAATCCRLHLVKPFGFTTEDKNLRRPGLDYWPFLDMEIHEQLDDVLKPFLPRVAFLSKFGKRSYREILPSTELIVFGRETSGLPEDLHEKYGEEHFYQIPMFHSEVRSLNLANAVSIVVYDMLTRRELLP